MAKVEEADPRWIVNDMGKAGTNVGRWHWQDINVFDWCKKRVPEICLGQTLLDTNEYSCKITKVSDCKGEAQIMNRKKKLFALYELSVSLSYEFTWKKEEPIICKGKFELPYLSQEDSVTEFEVKVSCEDDKNGAKDIVYKQGIPKLRPLISQFLTELKAGANAREKYEEWEKQQMMDSVNNTSSTTPSTVQPSSTTTATATTAKPASTTTTATTPNTASTALTSLELIEKFKCHAEDLFECFVDERRVSAYTQSKSSISRVVGGDFSLFNGAVVGKQVELVPGKKIVQKWRFNDWPADIYSTVTMEFIFEEGETTLKLKQTQIPVYDTHGNAVKKKVMDGWKSNFFIRIKAVFGYGSVMMY